MLLLDLLLCRSSAPFVILQHRFFTDRVMEFDSFRDVHAVFFPERAAYVLPVVMLVLSVPLAPLFGVQAAASFAATLALYYVTYEWLHLVSEGCVCTCGRRRRRRRRCSEATRGALQAQHVACS